MSLVYTPRPTPGGGSGTTVYTRRRSMDDAYRNCAADRPLITLRYDDNSIDNVTLANALAANGLVGSFALIRNAIQSGNGQLQVADILKMQLQGHEIMCHSYFHDTGPNTSPGSNYPAGTSIEAQMVKEFITAADEMYGMNIWTQQWIQPGTWTAGSGQGQAAYPPFQGGIAQQPFYDTDTGKQIVARYLGVSCYTNDGFGVQSGYRPRPPIRAFGKSTNYYDNKSIAQIQAIVEAAIAGDNHLQMFCHSGTFKLNGGSPTMAEYTGTFLPWLKAQVDAGRCWVVTESFGQMARRGPRPNLVGDKAFATAAVNGGVVSTLSTKVDTVNQFKSVTGPDGSTVTALSIAAGSNCNSDMQVSADAPLRSLRCSVWAKGDGGASQIAPTAILSGAQGLTPFPTVTLTADTWTRVDFNVGTAPQTSSIKPQWSVPSGAGNPALITNPIVTPT